MTAPQQEPAEWQDPSVSTRTHHHLWRLADGTPAHAPPGRLTLGSNGRLACHLCGRWFTHLGAHLRRHGWTAEHYRDMVGLPRGAALCSTELSQSIAVRQSRRFRHDLQLQQQLQTGIDMARSGELSDASRHARASVRDEHPALTEQRRAHLAAGRATRARRSEQRLDDLVRASGAVSLHAWLHREYAAGASLDTLRARTGLARARLRTELVAAGVVLRPSGHNVPTSKRRRAERNDRQLAEHLGVDDVVRWLHDQRAAGATLAALAERTGRSVPWIRSRLAAG